MTFLRRISLSGWIIKALVGGIILGTLIDRGFFSPGVADG